MNNDLKTIIRISPIGNVDNDSFTTAAFLKNPKRGGKPPRDKKEKKIKFNRVGEVRDLRPRLALPASFTSITRDSTKRV